ncbi:heavy metal translocating P-type ATPase [Rhodopirellula islandica]|nr:heavy metal translocating P-type ATPase [Rhodopirellula islandica]
MNNRLQLGIAGLAVVAIAVHLWMRFGMTVDVDLAGIAMHDWPLVVALVLGGIPLVWNLLVKLFRAEFGSDLLAGISIVTGVLLGEYLAATIVVLMLSGGEALEAYAVRSASSVLRALANRMPAIALRQVGDSTEEIPLDEIAIGDTILVLPHKVCPVDATVVTGHGTMDESYLTGEPYMMSKTPGSQVLSGAINGDSALTVRADKRAVDSRYAKIMEVMESSQQNRPKIRRLGDQLGSFYTPLAVLIGVAAWVVSGDPVRFLSVMVVATPCPLLIAIPVAILGAISLSARRSIIIRDPSVLEQVDRCKTMIFDKTGTLTYGRPKLVEQLVAPDQDPARVLTLVASLERYSKHPLAEAIVSAATERNTTSSQNELFSVSEISEPPGAGLRGIVDGHEMQITSRKKLLAKGDDWAERLPEQTGGLECVILIDGEYAATYRLRDSPRSEGHSFVDHLDARHGVKRVILLSGDRTSEVEYLGKQVGITECLGDQSPEDKLRYVTAETQTSKTVFVGDGINDAPALMAATVGIAFGQNSDVTTEAAGAVILDSSLARVDELMHISRRMRRIALQSAVGGMTLSVIGMLIASVGYLPPVAGAIAQEAIDVVAVLNALRVAWAPKSLTDF